MAAAAVVITVLGVFLIHDYIYFVSKLERIEFEQILERCDNACREDLEGRGFGCQARKGAGYVCVPPIDPQRVEMRSDHWDNLYPAGYGYLELAYDDKEPAIGLLRDIQVISEGRIMATFSHGEGDSYGDEYTLVENDFEITRALSIGDTFVPRCHNKHVFVYKLHDIVVSEGASYAVFVYRIGDAGMDRCVFPGLLQSSFGVKFDI